MSLVKQARNGDTAIGVDCTPEEMQEIVKAVWPKDPCFSLKSILYFIFEARDIVCVQSYTHRKDIYIQMRGNEDHLPIVSAQDFLKEIRQKEDFTVTQYNTIKQALLNGVKVSSWWAIQKHGITRLAKYICDLRKENYNIVDAWHETPSGKRFKIYWIEK